MSDDTVIDIVDRLPHFGEPRPISRSETIMGEARVISLTPSSRLQAKASTIRLDLLASMHGARCKELLDQHYPDLEAMLVVMVGKNAWRSLEITHQSSTGDKEYRAALVLELRRIADYLEKVPP